MDWAEGGKAHPATGVQARLEREMTSTRLFNDLPWLAASVYGVAGVARWLSV